MRTAIERGDPRKFRSYGAGYWYRADLGVSIATGVSQWTDLFGTGNDVTQVTGTKQPVFTASVAAINGKPSLDFDGVDDVLRKTGISISGAAGRTTFMAMKYAVAFVDGATALDGGNNQNRFGRFTDATTMRYFADGAGAASSVGSTFTPESWSYYTLSANGANAYIKDKRITKGVGTTATTSTMTAININTFGDGTSAPGGVSVAELFMYSSVISLSAEARIHGYLSARYAL